jgi:hypothetical protein
MIQKFCTGSLNFHQIPCGLKQNVVWYLQKYMACLLESGKQMLLLIHLKYNFKKCIGQTSDNGKTKDDTKTTSTVLLIFNQGTNRT